MSENRIATYTQDTPFTSANAGTAEWCFGHKDGREFFIKRFLSPTYPSGDLGLDAEMTQAMAGVFHRFVNGKNKLYGMLRSSRDHGLLVVPEEVFTYQFHLLAVSEKVSGDVSPETIHTLPPWDRLYLMGTLNAALAAVHDAGVVHSDLKPENLMITRDDSGRYSLRLIDFDGSFPESDPPTDEEEITGDMVYFAPETILASMGREMKLDRSIDLFALGIILHEFWTGTRPAFTQGKSAAQCLLLGGTVVPDYRLPDSLRNVIGHLLSLNPVDRPSCRQVDQVLREMISHLREPKRQAPVPPREEPRIVPEPEAPHSVEVTIEARNVSGQLLERRTEEVPAGERRTFRAAAIRGCVATGDLTRTVEAGADCPPKVLLTFVYRRKSRAGIAVAATIGSLVALGSLAYLAYSMGWIHF